MVKHLIEQTIQLLQQFRKMRANQIKQALVKFMLIPEVIAGRKSNIAT